MGSSGHAYLRVTVVYFNDASEQIIANVGDEVLDAKAAVVGVHGLGRSLVVGGHELGEIN